MSDLAPIAKPTAPPVAAVREARTIADVIADLTLAGAELNHHRGRRGDTVNNLERLAERPALLVREVNWLLDEWAALDAQQA
jgi:hypothetical protein